MATPTPDTSADTPPPDPAAPADSDGIPPLPLPEDVKAFDSDLSLAEAHRLCLAIGAQNGAKGCLQPDELAALLRRAAATRTPLRAYDGFEPSGRMHIAQGLLKAANLRRLTRCGVRCVLLVADWFALLNNKLGGDQRAIRRVGQYFAEVWRACGVDPARVEVVWASEEIARRPAEYWQLVLHLARHSSLARARRCGAAMGRADADDAQPCARLLYPLMQCADVFFLRADVCQLGLDQLKVNVLAREQAPGLGRAKPVVLSHPMLLGLKEGQAKMSKSDPDSAVWMEDSADEVRRKLRRAFCAPGAAQGNPVLDYLKNVVFAWHEAAGQPFELRVERAEKHGGALVFAAYEAAERAFEAGELHPEDLKKAVARELNVLLEPVRRHFSEGEARELLREVMGFRVTR